MIFYVFSYSYIYAIHLSLIVHVVILQCLRFPFNIIVAKTKIKVYMIWPTWDMFGCCKHIAHHLQSKITVRLHYSFLPLTKNEKR